MKKQIKLRIESDGAEILTGEVIEETNKSDLVRTSAEDKIRKAVDSAVVGLGDVAGVVLDVFEIFTEEAASRKIKEQGKMTVSFGVSGGVDASLKFVGAKAGAFMTVSLEISSNNLAQPSND